MRSLRAWSETRKLCSAGVKARLHPSSESTSWVTPPLPVSRSTSQSLTLSQPSSCKIPNLARLTQNLNDYGVFTLSLSVCYSLCDTVGLKQASFSHGQHAPGSRPAVPFDATPCVY